MVDTVSFISVIKNYTRKLFRQDIIGIYVYSNGLWVYNPISKTVDCDEYYNCNNTNRNVRYAINLLKQLREKYNHWRRPISLVCLEGDITGSKQRNHRSICVKLHNIGYQTYLFEEKMCVALGANIPIKEARKRLIVFVYPNRIHVFIMFLADSTFEIEVNIEPYSDINKILELAVYKLVETLPYEPPPNLTRHSFISKEESIFIADGWSKSIVEELHVIPTYTLLTNINPLLGKFKVVVYSETKFDYAKIGLQMLSNDFLDEKVIKLLKLMKFHYRRQ